MYTAALFMTAKKSRQPKYLLIDEQINKCGISIKWNIIQS